MRRNLYRTIAGCLLFTAVGFAQTIYKSAGTYPLQGEGFWDYLTFDTAANRLFIAHGTSIDVVDPQGKLLGQIPADGAHGTALVQDKNLGFSTNGRAGTITVFDLKSLKKLQDIKVSDGPDAIIYDPHSKHVVVMHGKSQSIEAINPDTKQIDATVPLGGKLEFAAADAGRVYINVEDKSEIAAVDTKTWKEVSRWKLADCEDPSGLAIDEKNHVLFTTCGNAKMLVLDTSNGKVVSTVKTGDGTDAGAFDPGTGYAFASNGEGTLTVVKKSGNGYDVAQDVQTMRSARTMAVDPNTHNVYLVGADFEAPAPGERRGKMKPGTFKLLVYSLAK
ncbi:MAG TPA: YncE family protein [Candidatus Koribacter sp.]|jgi:DNA-binding beta-propeller fold protein YncE